MLLLHRGNLGGMGHWEVWATHLELKKTGLGKRKIFALSTVCIYTALYVNMRCLINSVSEIEGWGRKIGTLVNFQLVSIFLLFYGSIIVISSISLLKH